MSAEGKAEILTLVSRAGLPRSRALAQLRLPRSTYYRWLKRLSEDRLKDEKGGSPIPWNKIRPEEETRILAEARASPELSCRQLALTITDSSGAYLSESTVYRVLKKSGLIKPAEIIGFKAAKEYRRKTKQPNELWASDCCHFKVIDWGWYYLLSVMDDCSRFILAQFGSTMALLKDLLISKTSVAFIASITAFPLCSQHYGTRCVNAVRWL